MPRFWISLTRLSLSRLKAFSDEGRVEQAAQLPVTGPGATRPAHKRGMTVRREELHEFQEILVRRLSGLAASGFLEAGSLFASLLALDAADSIELPRLLKN